MFTFADYTKAMEKFVSASPFEMADNVPFVDYQTAVTGCVDAAKRIRDQPDLDE